MNKNKIKNELTLELSVLKSLVKDEEFYPTIFQEIIICLSFAFILEDNVLINDLNKYFHVSSERLSKTKWSEDQEFEKAMANCWIFYIKLASSGIDNSLYHEYCKIFETGILNEYKLPADIQEYIDLVIIYINVNEYAKAMKLLQDINNVKKMDICDILSNILESLKSNEPDKLTYWAGEYKKYLDKTKDPNDRLLSQVYDYYYLYHFIMMKNHSFLDMVTHAYMNLYS
jgi:hypothetical protein